MPQARVHAPLVGGLMAPPNPPDFRGIEGGLPPTQGRTGVERSAVARRRAWHLRSILTALVYVVLLLVIQGRAAALETPTMPMPGASQEIFNLPAGLMEMLLGASPPAAPPPMRRYSPAGGTPFTWEFGIAQNPNFADGWNHKFPYLRSSDGRYSYALGASNTSEPAIHSSVRGLPVFGVDANGNPAPFNPIRISKEHLNPERWGAGGPIGDFHSLGTTPLTHAEAMRALALMKGAARIYQGKPYALPVSFAAKVAMNTMAMQMWGDLPTSYHSTTGACFSFADDVFYLLQQELIVTRGLEGPRQIVREGFLGIELASPGDGVIPVRRAPNETLAELHAWATGIREPTTMEAVQYAAVRALGSDRGQVRLGPVGMVQEGGQGWRGELLKLPTPRTSTPRRGR